MTYLSDAPAPYGTPRTRPAGIDFGGDELGSVTKATPQEKAKARRAVAARSRDASDCRDLLEHLGLIAPAAKASWRCSHKKGAAS